MDPEDYELGLVQRAAAGDTVALTLLLARSRGALSAHLTRRIPGDLRRVLDADDVIQEAHREVFLHIASFQPQGADAFYRWIATIALNILRNEVARARTTKRGGGRTLVNPIPAGVQESIVAFLDLIEGSVATASRVAARFEGVQAVRSAIGHLPQDYQQAVELVYIQGLTVEAAAKRMNRSERAIHNLCFKAKAYLRELLGSQSRFLSRG